MTKKSATTIIALIVTFFIILSNTACSEDAAMVMDIKRSTAYYEIGDKKGREIIILDFLKPGDRIRLKSGAVLVLNYFASGVWEEITGFGKITVGNGRSKGEGQVKIIASEPDYLPPIRVGDDRSKKDEDSQSEIIASEPNYFLPKAAFSREDLQQSGVTVFRGPGSAIVLEDIAFRSPRPIFRWPRVQGAENYVVHISGTDYNYKGQENSFTHNRSDMTRGNSYELKISAMVKDETLKEMKREFYILDQESLDKLILTEKKIRAECPEGSTGLLTRLAFVYRYYKLNDESADMLRKLHHRNPRNENIRRWLQKVAPAYAVKKPWK
ncbi:hypothetical protein QUF80_16455 [Desulfococcaceae bacterium HSG8]|nr:hypothetical protein [Desulfococcaceae bacterium HSG8]